MPNNDKTNWDRIKERDENDTMQYRDVYGDQQLERSHIGRLKTMTSRNVLNAALSVAVFFGTYIMIGFISGIMAFMTGSTTINGMTYYVLHFSFARFMIALVIAGGFFGIMYAVLKRGLEAQNAMNETSDINQYPNDQHIALPEEIQRKFDYFPDVGATSSVTFSSMISHTALSNKGLKPIKFARRVPEDIRDDDGDIVLYKGEILRDEDGNALFEEKEPIDIAFMEALYDASGVPKKGELRKYYDPRLIPYNPGNKDRDKLKGYETVADLINGDWEYPEYEPQRAAGAYLVDTAPVNTMVLAIEKLIV